MLSLFDDMVAFQADKLFVLSFCTNATTLLIQKKEINCKKLFVVSPRRDLFAKIWRPIFKLRAYGQHFLGQHF